MSGQKLLDNAIFYERRKNWKKRVKKAVFKFVSLKIRGKLLDVRAKVLCQEAVLFYNQLFELFKDDSFANLHKFAPEELRILKFQCYYHCAVAHQNLAAHSNAISMFQQAIRIVEQRKNGCSSGCVTGKGVYWSVPAYARKAFSEIYLGYLSEAHHSSEKAVLLDNMNSDVYCIRALVKFMLGDRKKAIVDVTHATKLNSKHICSLILQGWFENSEKSFPLSCRSIDELHKNNRWNTFEEKAYELNPSVVAYFGLPDNREKIIEVFNRYLPTIRCPHTITVYDVLRVVETKLTNSKAQGQRKRPQGNPIFESRSAQASDSDTRRTTRTFATNHSERDGVIEAKQSKETLSECCKECSSVEEFLKHLIWSEGDI